MAMDGHVIEQMLKEAFPEAKVILEDTVGDGDHWAALVISERFKGLTRVKQHQMVYAALQGKMGGELHALQLQTATPETAPDWAKEA